MVCHRQIMDTVRINEIYLWLDTPDINFNFDLVISFQKQISFTLPQAGNGNSVIYQGK